MPIMSLEDQGFNSGARMIMQGIAGFRAKKEFEKQQAAAEKDRELRQSAFDLDKRKYEDSLPTLDINKKLLQKQLDPTAFDPKKHVVSLDDGSRAVLNPVSGAVVDVIKPDVWRDFIKSQLGGVSTPVPTQDPNLIGPPEAPQAQTNAPQLRLSGVGPSGPSFDMQYPQKEPEVVERDIPGQGKQLFIRSLDEKTGKISLDPYRMPESAGKFTDKQTTLANLQDARRYAQEIDAVVSSKAGNWESRFGNPDAVSVLERNPYLLAIAMAKVLDPGSVAREGEVAAAKKFLLPMGLTVPNAVTRAAVKRQLADLDRRAENMGIAAPGADPGAGGTPKGIPLPKSEQELVVGTVYETREGPLKWDGRDLVEIK